MDSIARVPDPEQAVAVTVEDAETGLTLEYRVPASVASGLHQILAAFAQAEEGSGTITTWDSACRTRAPDLPPQ